MADVPYRFERDATAADLREPLRRAAAPGRRPASMVTVAGRLMLRREHGQAGVRHAARLDRRHPAVRGAAWTEDFDGLQALSLGDWIGVTGEVVAHPDRVNSR